jgi:hypothetical protein
MRLLPSSTLPALPAACYQPSRRQRRGKRRNLFSYIVALLLPPPGASTTSITRTRSKATFAFACSTFAFYLATQLLPLLHLLPLRLLPSAAVLMRLLLAVVKSKGAKSKAKVASEMK